MRRRDEVRVQLSRLRRRRRRLVSGRRQRARLLAELRALAGVEHELESLYRAKERWLDQSSSPLAADAAALRRAIEQLRVLPDEGATVSSLLGRARRLRSLQKQRSELLGS